MRNCNRPVTSAARNGAPEPVDVWKEPTKDQWKTIIFEKTRLAWTAKQKVDTIWALSWLAVQAREETGTSTYFEDDLFEAREIVLENVMRLSKEINDDLLLHDAVYHNTMTAGAET